MYYKLVLNVIYLTFNILYFIIFLQLRSSWAGYYEYNTFDKNGIIGVHPYYQNLIFATGFSGHGIQQSPAVGRAISELIVDGEFKTLDLSNLDFKRIIYSKPVCEAHIV